MILRDKIYINIKELGYRVSALCELFTYKNPEIFHKKRLKLSTAKIKPYLYHYYLDNSTDRKTLHIPRGGLSKVLNFYKEHSIPYRILDQRVEHPTINVILSNTTIQEQQNKIINILVKHEGGLIEASPGAGKTVAMLGFISVVKQPTLILVHELRLSDQWIFEIKKRLTGNYTLGKYDGGLKEEGDIVVGVINSAYNRFQEDKYYFNKFGTIIVDECQHLPSNMFLSVINNIPAKYRIGISGTVGRRDGKELLTYDVIGKILIRLKAPELKHRITNFTYKMVNTNINMELEQIKRWTGNKKENVLDITKSLTMLVEDSDRNNIIISEIIDCINQGYFPLVLSSRVKHNELLYEKLTDLGIKTILLIGKTRKKYKWEDIQKDTSIQCIVASDKIASEGLDLPRLSALVITCPSTNTKKLEQQLGRIRRVFSNKPLPLVIDICDNLVYFRDETGIKYSLLYMANKRQKFYESSILQYNA